MITGYSRQFIKFIHIVLVVSIAMSSSFGFGATCVKREELADMPTCGHCQSIQGNVDSICKRFKHEYDSSCYHAVIIDSKVCICNCSCVSGDTLISLADGTEIPIAEIAVGHMVAAPYADSLLGTVFELNIGDATGFPVRKLTLSNQRTFVASLDHVFVLSGGDLISFEKLKVGDLLRGLDGQPVAIDRLEDIPSFEGKLYNFIINPESNDAVHHLYSTNGVLSADFVVQVQHEQGSK